MFEHKRIMDNGSTKIIDDNIIKTLLAQDIIIIYLIESNELKWTENFTIIKCNEYWMFQVDFINLLDEFDLRF